VEVSVRSDDSKIVLTVKDFGMGVPREVLDRFWKTGNVGVGLAGIRERLKELGGSLEIESNLDGTLLRATIPVSLPDAPEPEDEEIALPTGEFSSAFPAD
jgi:signal transduction histidine kinase